MRICPKCGYHDWPQFRPRANRPYCEYSAIDNVGYTHPELIESIRMVVPAPYFDGHFMYHITRSGLNVERIEKEYYIYMKWGAEPQEKRDGHRSINVRKILREGDQEK